MAAEALEQSMLESKDKDQLLAIAQALGVKTTARAAKATLIGKILEMTGGGPEITPAASVAPQADVAPVVAAPAAQAQPAVHDESSTNGDALSNGDVSTTTRNGDGRPTNGQAGGRGARPTNRSQAKGGAVAGDPAPDLEVVLGPDGEPLADWEIALIKSGDAPVSSTNGDAGPGSNGSASGNTGSGNAGAGDDDSDGDDLGNSNSRRRRRRRNKNRPGDGPQGQERERFERPERSDRSERNDRSDRNERNDRSDRSDRTERVEGEQPVSQEPVQTSGYLDLRDEGYGFLRVNGYLASRDDAYIPVKLTRQYGLRKGDHVTGLSRPAGRNEKNPALLEIHTVNGGDPDKAKNRPRFEDLTALFPDERLSLENPSDPNNMTARIIDLISPIGKGQRGIIVSPPKAGKTTIMKTIATSIEKNHPEVKLMVLLIDERPEEVTDMRRTVKGEVISSTFDRPSDEHTHVAELAIEKAKRLVEIGEDVVIILDGITRLSRAYNLAAPASGRILSGGIDAGALYPPKRFFGAARNIEEGGSLTILATALVETNSRMDDAIFEEFKGTGNMELRLDRKLAERRIYPAIDVDASSTRHEELLFDRKQLQMVWKLRRVLSGLAADGNAAPGLELLVDRLKTFRSNDEFLNEIAKQPSM